MRPFPQQPLPRSASTAVPQSEEKALAFRVAHKGKVANPQQVVAAGLRKAIAAVPSWALAKIRQFRQQDRFLIAQFLAAAGEHGVRLLDEDVNYWIQLLALAQKRHGNRVFRLGEPMWGLPRKKLLRKLFPGSTAWARNALVLGVARFPSAFVASPSGRLPPRPVDEAPRSVFLEETRLRQTTLLKRPPPRRVDAPTTIMGEWLLSVWGLEQRQISAALIRVPWASVDKWRAFPREARLLLGRLSDDADGGDSDMSPAIDTIDMAWHAAMPPVHRDWLRGRRSLAKVAAYHDTVLRDYQRVLEVEAACDGDAAFPAAAHWLPEGEWIGEVGRLRPKREGEGGGVLHVRRLSTKAKLVAEGAVMQHCVGSYAGAARDGSQSFYGLRLLPLDVTAEPERATLSLFHEAEGGRMGRVGEGGVFEREGRPIVQIGQLQGRHNGAVSPTE